MTTETTAPDTAAEAKINQLRELFADAPEVGRKALENVLSRLASARCGEASVLARPGRAAARSCLSCPASTNCHAAGSHLNHVVVTTTCT